VDGADQGGDDAVDQQNWPDRLTVTRNSGVDYYYEQYRRLLAREESLLKERDALRRENAALRSRLRSSASAAARHEADRPRRARGMIIPAAGQRRSSPAFTRTDDEHSGRSGPISSTKPLLSPALAIVETMPQR